MCNPYIDFEYMQDAKPCKKDIKKQLAELITESIDIFNKKYHKKIDKSNIIILNSSGIKEDKYKVSFHIIIKSKYIFENNKYAKDFANELHKKFNQVDLLVYSDDRSMRCITSIKGFGDNRKLELFDPDKCVNIKSTWDDFKKYLITDVPDDYEIIKVALEDKIIEARKHYKINKNGNHVEITDDKVNKIIKKVQNCYMEDCFYEGQGEKNNTKYFHFNYPHDKYKCYNGLVHDQLGFHVNLDDSNNVFVKCFSANCNKTTLFLGNLFDEILNFENVNIVKCDRLAENKLIQKCLAELFKDGKSICFQSCMGTGKTYLVTFCFDNYKIERCLILSVRQSFTKNIHEKLKEKYNFFSYLDEKYYIYKQDRVIVQLESLLKLLNGNNLAPFDLIVMDEIESVLNQLSSDTARGKSKEIFDLLFFLCKCAKTKIISLDADYGERAELFMNAIGKHVIVKNDYVSIQYRIKLTRDFDKVIKEIFETIEKGFFVAVIGLSPKLLTDIAEDMKKKNIKYLLYIKETDDAIKNKLGKVNDDWSDQQCVLFDSSITVGVDYNQKHFHKIFSFLNTGSVSPRVYLQMLGRIRILEDTEVLTYVDKSIAIKMDENLYTYEEMEDYFTFLDNKIAGLERELVISENGSVQYVNKNDLFNKILIHNAIEKLNSGGKYFITQLNLLCSRKGYMLMCDNQKYCIKKTEMEKGVFYKKIIESKDLKPIEALGIQNKIIFNTATEEDKFALKKYEFKHFWKLEQVDKESIETYYGKEENLIKLKYILGRKIGKEHTEGIKNIAMKATTIKNIIKCLGFDLSKMDIILDRDTFYKNLVTLRTSNFGTNYDNIRMLFDKPKKELPTGNGYLVQTINSLLNEFGVEIKLLRMSKKQNKKNVKINTYSMAIIKIYEKYIN